MTQNEMEKQILSEYAYVRRQNIETAEKNLNALLENKKFSEMYTGFLKAKFCYIKNKSKENKQKLDVLAQNFNRFCTENKIDLTSVEPQYNCRKCMDTGIINNKYCECFNQKLAQKLAENMPFLKDKIQFCKSDEKFLSDKPDLKKIYIKMQEWLKVFPETEIVNLNFIGESGVGKTHLLTCIANELVMRGFFVQFVSAFAINDEFRKYNFGIDSQLDNYFNAEVLIIDDFGSEPMLKNITKEYFFNLIDLRQRENKITLISTNLDMENLFLRYGERTYSRLMNKRHSLSVNFESEDNRLNLKKSK